jgi:hypothetical protein
MNKKHIFLAVPVVLLALSMVFAGCKQEPASDPTDTIICGLGTGDKTVDVGAIRGQGLDTSGLAGATAGDYIMIFGAIEGSMGDVDSATANQSWYSNLVSVGSSKYITGSSAVDVFNYCLNLDVDFVQGGALKGTYSSLVNFTSEGQGLPGDLRTELASKSGDIPIAGAFPIPYEGMVVVFYVDQVK